MYNAFLRITGLMSLVLTLALMTGCSITDPSDDFELAIQMPATGTVISGQIFDGNGDPLDDQVVRVNISGRDANTIVNLLNEPVSRISTRAGFIVFAVNDSIMPTLDNPIEISLKISADGYITAYKNLVFYSANDQFFDVSLFRNDLSDLPPEVASAEDNSGLCDNNGTVTAPVNLDCLTNPNTGAVTSINIAAGTRILDENGAPLTGALTTNIMVIDISDPEDRSAANYFPGGLDNVLTNESDMGFFPKVFTSFAVEDNAGNVAASFDPPVALSVQLCGDMNNPNTMLPLADGDTLSLFDMDENGIWTHQVDRPISGPDANGNFTFVYNVAEPNAMPNIKSRNIMRATLFPSGISRCVAVGGAVVTPTISFFVKQTIENGNDLCTGLNYSSNIYRFTKTNYLTSPSSVISISTRFSPIPKDGILEDIVIQATPSSTYSSMHPGLVLTTEAHWIPDSDTLSVTVTYPELAPEDEPKSVDIHLFGLMPEGSDPSVIRPSGITALVQEVGQDSWTLVGAIQEGTIKVNGLTIGSEYIFRGLYTYNDSVRTTDTPWSRMITENTDSLHFRYQMSQDEADDYESN